MSDRDRDKTAERWDRSEAQYQPEGLKLYWELLAAVQRYQNEEMTGDAGTGCFAFALEHLKKRRPETGLRGLSIGCNEGNPACEMVLVEGGRFDGIKVVDIAGGLLSRQHEIALSRGLHGIDYCCIDLNDIVLEADAYDLIWAVGTVHHVERLEHLFGQIDRALRPGGIFMMREYVGPSRLQFTDEQLRIVNDILRILPEPYKKTIDGRTKTYLERYDVEAIKAHDPSESVRSDEIMGIAEEHLKMIMVAETGGTLLHPLLSDIAFNFETSEEGRAMVDLLIYLEKILIKTRLLPSDYVFCLAEKRLD